MKSSLFGRYIVLREEENKPAPNVTSKIKLQKQDGNREFSPFTINRTTHPNLRMLVKAFLESDKIGLGYTTIEKNKGEVEPQLKKKSLWLTGGAVRDHLKGKTPRNYDLVTDATPSEIRMILTKSEDGFKEVKPKNDKYSGDERYQELPSKTGNREFYVCRWDGQGKELEVCVEINGEMFRLSTLGKHSKSKRVNVDKGIAATSVEEDAQNRDFTINSMYIPLTTADGDNSDLIDPHGGAHHMKTGEIVAVGSMNDRLKEDPTTAMKYIRMMTRFGGNEKIPDRYKQTITRFKDMDAVQPDEIRSEFLTGLEHPDSDPKKYIQAYADTGLLDKVFPDVEFDLEDMPEEFHGDRWLASAWILKENDPEQVNKVLVAGGWSKQEANDVCYLVKLYHWGEKNGFDSEMFYDLKKNQHGLTKSKIREWMQMVEKHGPEVDAFLNHEDSDLRGMVSVDGRRKVNPEFSNILGRNPIGGEFGMLKKYLSTKRWQDSLNKLK